MSTELKSTIPPVTRQFLNSCIEQGVWPAPAGQLDGVDYWTEQQILEAMAYLVAISNGSKQPGLFKSVQ